LAAPARGNDDGAELGETETWAGAVCVGEVWILLMTEGVEAVRVEAPGVQVVSELPPTVILSLQASLFAASATKIMISLPGFKLVVY